MPAPGIRRHSARQLAGKMPRASAPPITWFPSPNCGPRRDGARPDMIVLHYTAMDTAKAARDRLCDSDAEVSAHYLIGETGQIWQLVEEEMRAWHAGAGQWGSVTDVNSRSIGIELANTGLHPFSEPQMAALEVLMTGIMARWNIAPERVIGHSDMAPDRKFDPGPRFDWLRLARQGLSIWYEAVQPAETNIDEFKKLSQAIGYKCKIPDEFLLFAVRSRFRPWAEGPLDAFDSAIVHNLAERFPVDPPVTSA